MVGLFFRSLAFFLPPSNVKQRCFNVSRLRKIEKNILAKYERSILKILRRIKECFFLVYLEELGFFIRVDETNDSFLLSNV